LYEATFEGDVAVAVAGLNKRDAFLQLITLLGTVGPEKSFAMPAAVETSFQIGYVFVECIYCFFAEVDGMEARRCGEKDGCEDREGETNWPHGVLFKDSAGLYYQRVGRSADTAGRVPAP
jgi:hypothetical protein